MKIVIPMAGFGTRLRPLTWTKPKPLVNVAGKAMLGHFLDSFTSLEDIDEVIFIVGYLGTQVEEYVAERYPQLKARYVIQEEMLGQSHAVWLAREDLRGPMLIAFVDTLIETDLVAFTSGDWEAAICVKEVDDPRRYGVVELSDGGQVRQLIEKPQDDINNLAVVGFYYFQQAELLIHAIEEQMQAKTHLKGEYFLADAINVMLKQGLQLRAQEVAVWQDCGTPEALLETNRYLLENGRDNSSDADQRPAMVVVPPVFIDPTAEVRHSVIGPHVTIAAGCFVERSLIRDSIVDTNSTITDSMLSASLIGRRARVVGRDRSLKVGDSSEIGFV